MIDILTDIIIAVYFTAFFGILLAVVAHILLNKHEEPASAIMWIVVVSFFPVVGFVFYMLFGINRVKTLGMSIKLANELVDIDKSDPVRADIMGFFKDQKKYVFRDEHEHHHSPFSFGRTLDRLLPENIPLRGNSVRLLKDGNMAYPEMKRAIENAQKTINLQSFIIMGDKTGREFFDILERKAREGVRVKVLYDRFGSGKTIFTHFFSSYMKEDNPNFKIRPFARINLLTPWRFQLRNHRKVLVVDGETAFVGGINISGENLRPEDTLSLKYIHDLHCEVRGPSVSEFQMSFLRDWCFASGVPFYKIFNQDNFPRIKEAGESIVRVVDSGPGQGDEAAEKLFYTALSTARRQVWIMTPYFVPDKAFIKALCMCVARGVEARVIIPKNNNHWYVDMATKSLYRTLLGNGVRIFEKKGSFSHAKAMLVDGEWGMMGSSNCDIRSFRLNYELDFIVSKGKFMEELHKQFKEELAESEEVALGPVLAKRLPRRLAENICSLLTPIL